MPRRFRSRRSKYWPARPGRRTRRARPGGAAADRPRGDDALSPLAGLRATLNAFCHFFAADPADSRPRP